jgi:hypothetical protein
MPIFGSKEMVGVQFELDVESLGPWLFGKFCYWVRGRMIGDFDLGTSLSDVLSVLAPVIKDNGRRRSEKLYALSSHELCNLLDSGLYGSDAEIQARAIEEQWARFQIDLPIDVFDECRVYLLDGEQKSRIVLKHLASGILEEFAVDLGAFDAAAGDAFAELQRSLERG